MTRTPSPSPASPTISTVTGTLPGTLAGLRDHWQWRPDWQVDRACLLWYLTFEDAPGLRQRAERAQARLGDIDGLDAVPPRWLHLTLHDVGFADEVTPAQEGQLARAARAAVAGWVPPPLTLGPLTSMADCLVLPAEPVAELTDLHERLRATTGSLGGAFSTSLLDDFWPHVTLAYLNRDSDEPLLPLAAGEPFDTPVEVPTPRLTLAAVTRRDRHYQWTTRTQLPLDSSGRPPG